jgi:hypothetical protein
VRTAHALPAIGGRRPAGGAVRALRTASGLVLAVYVTAHFVNHALGVISVDAQEALLVVLVWTHLLIGVHYWLRLRSGYRRALPIFYPIAVMVPLLALLGFWGSGIELREIAGPAAGSAGAPISPGYASIYAGAEKDPKPAAVDPAARALVRELERLAYAIYGGMLGLVLLGRVLRRVVLARGGTYRIHHRAVV